MKILVTGGLGYIGSHTVVELLESNIEVVVIDNLSNSSINVKDNIKKITNKDFTFYKEDLLNELELEKIFKIEKIDGIIHFAGYKAVGESVKLPLKYYENNIVSTLNLLKCMEKFNVYNIIFSSSATVYGNPKKLPITEDFDLHTTNPYGDTKLFIENILKNQFISNNKYNIVILRYFNPIGAHNSGLIGENPNGIPNNLMPYISQVGIGKLKELSVYGNDYNTHDGTGVRDYIHVCDLANGHKLALKKFKDTPEVRIYNLGTGVGYSVLDVIKTYEKINNLHIPYKITNRRPGDIASCYADATKAYNELGFKCKYNLEDMCRDTYNFQKNFN